MEKPKLKTNYSLALPYPQPEWPSISPEAEDVILTLLLRLLEPIGEYRRRTQRPPKKKKRARKRNSQSQSTDNKDEEVPESPDILNHLTIGFNSTIRQLESSSQKTKLSPQTVSEEPSNPSTSTHLAAVFARVSAIPEPVRGSFPLLVATAGHNGYTSDPVKLVSISAKTEALIAQSLGQPRVAVLGLAKSAPGSQALFQYMQKSIQSDVVPWLQQLPAPPYLSVNIKETEVSFGKKVKSRKRKVDDQ